MNKGLGITKEGVELQAIIFEGKIYICFVRVMQPR